MTREIKEADAKVKKGLKEKRRHFKAVGLKTGEAIEEFFVPDAGGGGGAASDAGVEGGRTGNDGNHTSGDGGRWTKGSLRVPKQTSGRSSNGVIAEGEPVEAYSSVTADMLPMKRAWVVSEGGAKKVAGSDTAETEPKRGRQDGDNNDPKDGNGAVSEAGGDATVSKRKTWGGGGGNKGRDAGGSSGGLSKCELGNCSKTAIFGVNGTVRYW